MRRFILKISLFVVIILVLCNAIKIFVPYHWGNAYYSVKIRHLEKQKIFPHAVFFGSSRIYRQVDIAVFDSTYSALSGERIRSFNLGAPATFCPQSYFLFEHFLRSDAAKEVKYAFLEITDIDIIGSEVMHEARTNYWHNVRDYYFVLNSVLNNQSLGLAKKCEYFRHYTVSYLENTFNIGHFGEMMVNDHYYDPIYLGESGNGYMSLEEELRTSTNKNVRKNLIQRVKSLKQKGLDQRAAEAKKYLQKPLVAYDHIHLNRIQQLQAMARAKGVKLIFILCPRSVNAYSGSLYQALPHSQKIQLASPQLFPELYEKHLSYDIGHLNEKGSKIFSALLAREFYRLQVAP